MKSTRNNQQSDPTAERWRNGTTTATYRSCAFLLLSLCLLSCEKKHSDVEAEMARLVQSWQHADGVAVYDAADSLFDAMLRDPDPFFSAMRTDIAGFTRFLDNLVYTVFTNQNDTVFTELESKREHALRILKEARVSQANERMLERAITTLENLRPRWVG